MFDWLEQKEDGATVVFIVGAALLVWWLCRKKG